MIQLKSEILNEVPKIDAESAIYAEPQVFFSNVHTKIEQVNMSEYHQFLIKLEKYGFKAKHVCENGLRDFCYNAVFEKNGRVLYLRYVITWKRIYMNYGIDPYLSAWTGQDVFVNVPKLYTHEAEFYAPQDCGAGNYLVEIDCVTMTDYQDYLSRLEENQFSEFAVNEEGVGGTVFCANYEKENLYVTVIYIANMKKIYVSACYDQPFSEHLLYKNTYVEGNKEGAQTSLHMLKLEGGGNSFVWKLKNGHFLVSDGGLPCDTDILYEYLEKETPEDEKPVVEGWFISHGHMDHCGPFECIASQPEKYADRIFVEGIYYNEPNDLVMSLDPQICKASTVLVKDALNVLKTTMGKNPRIYRTQTGQRYYFNDVIVDIAVGQEQIPFKHYSGDMNDSSTWCMFHVEGQKCMFGGDGDRGGMKFITCAYDRSYMEVELFTLLHHGWNTRDFFTNFCKVRTTLVTCLAAQGCKLPAMREKENAHMKEQSEEWISWEDGTKVFVFPYKVGNYRNGGMGNE